MTWWIRNNNTLKKVIEKVAKASFQASQDPLDAAIFYLAMKKKSLVWGLYRSIKDEKMTAFFKNNFSEDRWRKAALKNAFALLSDRQIHSIDVVLDFRVDLGHRELIQTFVFIGKYFCKKFHEVSQKTILIREKWERSDHFASII